MPSASRRFIEAVDPAAPPPGLAGAVVAIGNFDGLHRGHRGVIERAQALAEKLGAPCAVLTFEPHPADFFAGRSVMFRLTGREAKAAFLERLGLDGMIVLTFDAALAGLSAEQFVADVLVRRLGVKAAVAGYDFHFGARRQGTPQFLEEAGRRYGFAVEIVPRIAQDAEGSLDAVSSTAVRQALEQGDVALAARLLGHPWFVEGVVVHGQKLGRTIGFPTANIALDPSCRLRHGIYAVSLTVDGKSSTEKILGGAANFGRRPTFDNGAPLLEVYVFDFDGDLYGKTVEVAFLDFLRPEEKFASVEALVAQMREDVAKARAITAAAGL
ncbi:MAG: bifunctional riboflavin kinase/FAD synthetase [Hyphomicrobiales bacterium]|nr:bifunctional riboflavin kinase/FAD synthetase [Hyphomicrobiales bacterium]